MNKITIGVALIAAALLSLSLPAKSAFAQTGKDAGDAAESIIGPMYADAPELTVKDDVPKGTLHEFTMNSTDSKVYPGIAKDKPGQIVPYQRQVVVYVPKQYVPGKPAPFIVVHDGLWYKDTMACGTRTRWSRFWTT